MPGAYKDFAGWTGVKIDVQQKEPPRFFTEREIWWAAIGHNVGDEEDGKGSFYARPVLILRKFNKSLFWGIPMTTTRRTGKYYMRFSYGSGQTSVAILSQLRAFDSKRLLERAGTVKEFDFALIQLGLVKILGAEPHK